MRVAIRYRERVVGARGLAATLSICRCGSSQAMLQATAVEHPRSRRLARSRRARVCGPTNARPRTRRGPTRPQTGPPRARHRRGGGATSPGERLPERAGPRAPAPTHRRRGGRGVCRQGPAPQSQAERAVATRAIETPVVAPLAEGKSVVEKLRDLAALRDDGIHLERGVRGQEGRVAGRFLSRRKSSPDALRASRAQFGSAMVPVRQMPAGLGARSRRREKRARRLTPPGPFSRQGLRVAGADAPTQPSLERHGRSDRPIGGASMSF